MFGFHLLVFLVVIVMICLVEKWDLFLVETATTDYIAERRDRYVSREGAVGEQH